MERHYFLPTKLTIGIREKSVSLKEGGRNRICCIIDDSTAGAANVWRIPLGNLVIWPYRAKGCSVTKCGTIVIAHHHIALS